MRELGERVKRVRKTKSEVRLRSLAIYTRVFKVPFVPHVTLLGLSKKAERYFFYPPNETSRAPKG